MGLQDLNEDIYDRDYENSREVRSEYVPGKNVEGNIGFGADQWRERLADPMSFRARTARFFSEKRRWVVVAAVVFVLVGLLVSIPFVRTALFSDARVVVEIDGPREVASVETVQYIIRYENGNVLSMNDAEVTVLFPESFKMDTKEGISVSGNLATIPLGTVSGRSEGAVKISGKFYGSKGSLVYLKALLRFAPSGMSSRFEQESQTGVTIASSPLALEISAPQEIASGNEIEYVFAYRNDSDLSFSNLRVKAEYPKNFRFNSSEPRSVDGTNSWRLGNLLPRASGEIRVRGIMTGNRDEAKVIRASVGVLQGDDSFLAYDQRERLTRIVASPLSIVQTVNGKSDISVNPGDQLEYRIRYSNDGDIGLRDAIVTVEVNASSLDMTRLRANGGAYDAVRNIITWKAPDSAELARLEPRQGGDIAFSVPVRSDIGTSGEAGKHLIVRTIAKIDSPDIPFSTPSNKVIASNALEVRIGSVVGYEVFGFHKDVILPNSGPVPPKSGVETTYTFRFRVTNYLNDLSRAKVTATLPTGVRYTGKKIPESESFSYNERTGQLVWDIGSIWGGGKVMKELSFQLAIVPGPNEIGKAPELLLGSSFEAEDAFTQNVIRLDRPAKTTVLKEDISLSETEQLVVP